MNKSLINYLLLCFLCISILSCTQSKKELMTNDNIIELALVEKEGYGQFNSGFRGISPFLEIENNPWRKTYKYALGIPDNWIDVKQGDINLDMHQFVYQNYHLGNISKDYYESLQKSWNWTPDTLNLSKKPLKSSIAFAFGKDTSGEIKMIIDANNNLNFSDDKIFKPIEYPKNESIDKDSLALNNSIEITYERLKNNNIVEVNAPLFIMYLSEQKMFLNNFPQYLVTEFEGEEIMISSNNFMDLSFNKPEIVLLNKNIKKGDKMNPENIVSINNIIEINEKVYKNIGVDKNKNVLILEKINLPKNEIYSTSIGFKSFPLEGNNFITNSPISLEDFKGKYILLDFWATWCGPCIIEMPNLKTLYDKVDKSKFEIVGVVGDSSSEDLKKMLDKQSINWPNILSDDKNKIKETYGVQAYPTTFLINPEGVIVAKNLRGKELEDKILNLIDNNKTY